MKGKIRAEKDSSLKKGSQMVHGQQSTMDYGPWTVDSKVI